ncbi:uncharacterized protein LOC123536139 isoform X1 [Mercenaria mercenaria]|uniref:uncharacterized protein LOC123536139 isoform X1 n=1 Tax=Mercenaria mercenaria TaxID=6596 RepID=UPI00234F8937|nr:uncharacterized protein LOC123536139 isoform X1 [Mercenaria mercenaria]XP_053385009.1 uncharacterized protein LOC123536139 isoform X1 [Mercenaria mercenaria]XP_053385010.1 uncharacterized protein LOC123536139 isoform X1 [Mercenaria mercenaria]
MAESSSLARIENDSNTNVTNLTEYSELEGTRIKGSDEVFQMFCETCNRDGKHAVAYAFCKSCLAFFCSTCLKFHGLFLLGHEYLEGENMPQDSCTEKCKAHNNEIIKFYCATCSKFACPVCKIEDHKGTCTIKYLPDIVNEDIENGKYLKELMVKVNSIAKQLTDAKAVIDMKYERLKSTNAEAISAIKIEKETLFAEFDQEVYQSEEKIQVQKKNDDMRLVTAKEQFDSLAAEIEELSKNSKSHSSSPKSPNYKLFITLKQCCDRLSNVKDTVECLTKDCTTSSDAFESEHKIKANELTRRVKEFGRMTMSRHIKSKEMSPKEQQKIAYPMKDINVRAEGDEKDCYIIDFCMLSDQYLIACDKNNSSLKLIDTRNNKLEYVRSVKSKPESVTKINDSEIAMAQCFDRDSVRSKIQFLNLTKAKTLAFQRRYILTQMFCYTVVYINDGRLIISMSQDHKGKIQILNMKGKVLANIEVNGEGNKIFKSPWCISLDSKAKCAYVTDWCEDSIFEIDLGTKATRKIAYFWHPEGITTDKDGFIYVIASGTNRIHCFHPKNGFANAHGTKLHVMSENFSANSQQSGILYSATDNKLYVGYFGHDSIKVYRISDYTDTDKEVKKIKQ